MFQGQTVNGHDWQVTGSMARMQARAAHEAGVTLRVGFGAMQSFAGGFMLGGETFAQTHRRDGQNPIFGIRRGADKMTGIALHTWRNTRVSFALSRSFQGTRPSRPGLCLSATQHTEYLESGGR